MTLFPLLLILLIQEAVLKGERGVEKAFSLKSQPIKFQENRHHTRQLTPIYANLRQFTPIYYYQIIWGTEIEEFCAERCFPLLPLPPHLKSRDFDLRTRPPKRVIHQVSALPFHPPQTSVTLVLPVSLLHHVLDRRIHSVPFARIPEAIGSRAPLDDELPDYQRNILWPILPTQRPPLRICPRQNGAVMVL